MQRKTKHVISLDRRNAVSLEADNTLANYAGDLEAEVSRRSPVLFHIALQRLRNVEDAEDAVQDALLSAHKCLSQFQGRSRFSTWLTRIVINTSLMKLRGKSRYELVSLDHSAQNDDATLAEEIVDARPNPEVTCARAEMEEKLHRALASISPKLRIAFQMRVLCGMSAKETANVLGISVNTLKSRMVRVRAALGLRLGSAAARHSARKLVPVDVN
jgi:RNA polymerase sigma-70 factor (ECF subfamily)